MFIEDFENGEPIQYVLKGFKKQKLFGNIIFKKNSFEEVNKENEDNLQNLYYQIYSDLIKEAFILYVNSGFDENDLLSFSFEKMPLCFSKDKVNKI